jgi:hypothetical protein
LKEYNIFLKIFENCKSESAKLKKWNSAFFVFSLILEIITEKGVAIYEATLVNLQSKPRFHQTKIIFNEYYREVQTIKKPLIDIIFVVKIFFW